MFFHRHNVLHTTKVQRFWRSAAECSLASLALLLLTVIFYRLNLNLTTVSLLYVIVIVVVSRVGSFVAAVVSSVIASFCLAHLAPPRFSFRVDDPLDELAIACFLITSFIIASLVSTVRKQKEEALSSVNHKVIDAEERERQRIANDLHEGIGQRLTLLVIRIEQLKEGSTNGFEMRSRIDGILKECLQVLTDVKALAHELYSPRLEYLGIAGIMNSFCTDFRARNGVEIDFQSDGSISFVPPNISLCLLGVLQEALHNAVKHSGVRRFDVHLNGTSDEIHLTVRDCGAGFNPENEKTSGGLGFNRMRERLKLLKGSLSVESQPKRGTTIHARVPLRFANDSMAAAG